jgi:hypothetical protein
LFLYPGELARWLEYNVKRIGIGAVNHSATRDCFVSYSRSAWKFSQLLAVSRVLYQGELAVIE